MHDSARVPTRDWHFAFGPMMPLVAGAIATLAVDIPARSAVLDGAIIWASAILIFLSGVRRGLSFRTQGGPKTMQIATMLGLFVLGCIALVAARMSLQVGALAALLVGYLGVLVLDPVAARHGDAPLHFERLRRCQIPVALVSLTALPWQAF